MTRRLYLLRHAQAAAAPVGGRDYDRPLDGQGEADARALARTLLAAGLSPGLVVCSGAARTRGTLACLEPALAGAERRFDDGLYDGGDDAYRDASLAGGRLDVMVVGHNPMVGGLARTLSDGQTGPCADRLSRGFPTCALAIFRLDEPSDLESARLEDLMIPPHRPR